MNSINTHTHTRVCVVSHRPLQGYSQPHKTLAAANDAAWAWFDWSTSQPSQPIQPLLGPSQHLLQISSTLAPEADWQWSSVFFYLNEDGSCHKDHLNPWRLALLGCDCPACILSHCHSLQNLQLWWQTKKIAASYHRPPFSSIWFYLPLWHISKWKKKHGGVQFQGNPVFYTIFTCNFEFILLHLFLIWVYFPTNLPFNYSLAFAFCPRTPWDH